MTPDAVAERLQSASSPVLLLGASQSFVAELARATGRLVVTADIGAPLFGAPGAIGIGRYEGSEWKLLGVEALCTLDAARFRLPLLLALKRAVSGDALVQLPGVKRGMAAAELVTGAITLTGARTILLGSEEAETALVGELTAGGVEWLRVAGDADSRRNHTSRTARTGLWDDYLDGATTSAVALDDVSLLGAPPSVEVIPAWPGRQVALLDAQQRTLALGEALEIEGRVLLVKAAPFDIGEVRALLTRDARRSADGFLATERRALMPAVRMEPDLEANDFHTAAPVTLSLSSAKAALVNGVFGDPLLHVRLRHLKRSLLFDLGDSARLPARIVHQVSDVFISHAHFDHIGGFLWFLRSCLGSHVPRRLFGPPGLVGHIRGMVAGIHWDRIGERGPVFELTEVGESETVSYRLKVGVDGLENLGTRPLTDGVLVDEAAFRVRVTTLDHGIPVLAFAFEEARVFQVRKDALVKSGYDPGAWLSTLKMHLHRGEHDAQVELPDGSSRSVEALARELVLERPGNKLCYATDLDDNMSNRQRLAALAREAAIFICEASFLSKDAHLARATQHLTARACGEIAAAANVRTLVPFHFSKRYERDVGPLYDEVRAAFPRVRA
jgi:ribonuclease BN (tRNA processing enzyme)